MRRYFTKTKVLNMAYALRDRLYKWTKDDYGLKEAIFFPKGIDGFLRYSKILNELKKITLNEHKKKHILEVGAGAKGGIARFLKYSGDFEKFEVTLTDIDASKLKNVRFGNPVIADGCNLPFKDNGFDIVVSVDVLEHIPQDVRKKFLEELKRVCRKSVLLHFVVHDPENGFLGKDADLKFQERHIRKFKKPDPATAEHIAANHPSLKEVQVVFDNSPIIKGTQNVNIWFRYMTFRSSIIGFLAGFLYYSLWKRRDGKPPFHGCFLKWDKNE